MNRTETIIKKTFLSLYSKLPIEKISVKLLAKEAGINRSTFYDHFLDIYDVRDRIEAEFIDSATAMIEYLADWFFDEERHDITKEYNEFYSRNHQMLDIFFNIHPSARLFDLMKSRAQIKVCKFFDLDYDDLDLDQRFILEYMSGGQLHMVANWLARGDISSVAHFIDLMKNINTRGAVTCLMSGK